MKTVRHLLSLALVAVGVLVVLAVALGLGFLAVLAVAGWVR